jgi:hypothetical protein
MRNGKTEITLHFSGWRGPKIAVVDPAEVHRFVRVPHACAFGCAKCGFPADYPTHLEKAA